MAIFTVNKISEETGLSRRMVLRHINGKTLECTKVNGGYEIDVNIYSDWKNNIPDLKKVAENSVFGNYKKEEYADNNLDLIDEIDVSHQMYDITSGIIFDKESNLTFADFFSGAGGISCGFSAAGFRPVLFVDNFKEATDTYKRYFVDGLGFELEQDKNILDITSEDTKKYVIDILKKEHPYVICGGFPCQGFSMSGTTIATDPRNRLYQDMLDIVREVRPEFIVMENVTGILSMLEGNVIRKIIHDYAQIGYAISWKVLNAADYGVPQSRKRVIFIGNRLGKKNLFPQIIYESNNYRTVEYAIGRFENEPENKKTNHIFSKHSKEMQERLLAVPLGKSLYEKYHDSWKKCPGDQPSCTIKENHGATNIHYKLPRVITPREMAALQSFPDDFIFEGTKAKQIKQIGNAVPPVLAQAIAYAIKNEIYEYIEDVE